MHHGMWMMKEIPRVCSCVAQHSCIHWAQEWKFSNVNILVRWLVHWTSCQHLEGVAILMNQPCASELVMYWLRRETWAAKESKQNQFIKCVCVDLPPMGKQPSSHQGPVLQIRSHHHQHHDAPFEVVEVEHLNTISLIPSELKNINLPLWKSRLAFPSCFSSCFIFICWSWSYRLC